MRDKPYHWVVLAMFSLGFAAVLVTTGLRPDMVNFCLQLAICCLLAAILSVLVERKP